MGFGGRLLVTLHHRKCLCKSFVPPKQLEKDGEMFPGCPGLVSSLKSHCQRCPEMTTSHFVQFPPGTGDALAVPGSLLEHVAPIWVPLAAGVQSLVSSHQCSPCVPTRDSRTSTLTSCSTDLLLSLHPAPWPCPEGSGAGGCCSVSVIGFQLGRG